MMPVHPSAPKKGAARKVCTTWGEGLVQQGKGTLSAGALLVLSLLVGKRERFFD